SLSQIKNLSTGMKQKVSLAISIAHDPDIIIYDEPTNGLDIMASRDVENFLEKLKSDGKTIVISTHIFSLVEKLCDEVGIILNGQMALQDDLHELTKERSLEEVFFSLVEEDAA
ncbi:MAG: ATP-binding cassette domain-containing protein, partial [Bacilli bacterium]|nr:ATP-binding cassette domain-containing protein [Bacilli bacterium]